jgi:hypothetical protein
MTLRGDRLSALGLAAAVAALAGCANDEPGLLVSVDLGGFVPATRKLRIAISAADGGFDPQTPNSVKGVGVSTEDVDGDGSLELVTEFLNPGASISFRVATDNEAELIVRGQAQAFDDTKLIAAADPDPTGAKLPAGGRGSIALKLTERPGGVIGPATRTPDIRTAQPDVTIKTTVPASFSSIAVCDVDADRKPDLVVGAPRANNMNLNGVGAVYVLLGTGGFGKEIDPENGGTVMGFHFFGQDPGDRLGAAVACADLDGDGVDDLIVGAPGAALGTGQVYAVFGHSQIRNRAIKPQATGADAPDVTWRTGSDSGFGTILFAADLNADGKAELLVASPDSGKVHLLKNVTQRAAAHISVDGADHVTFSNVAATSLTAGDLQQKGGVDVVIGDSAATRPNTTMGGGAIFGFADVDLNSSTQYDARSPSTTMYGERDMLFGAAVLALTTTSRPGQDLLVGAPGANGGQGAVYVFQSDDDFFGSVMRDIMIDQTKVIDGPEGGRFGTALAGTPTGRAPTSSWDLIVGAPATRHSDDRPLGGAAYLFGGGDGWLFPLYERLFGAAATDGLGTVVAGGQVDSGDEVGDLVTIAPNATASGAAESGIVYIIFGRTR